MTRTAAEKRHTVLTLRLLLCLDFSVTARFQRRVILLWITEVRFRGFLEMLNAYVYLEYWIIGSGGDGILRRCGSYGSFSQSWCRA
ncbi:hypothetical protein BJV82DRAFT_628022 [Fennellomyces sp. T-0311]|nr:hypothetical protein BJV82DRAFT_628022 [Fennellomyces sp. T-0311]